MEQKKTPTPNAAIAEQTHLIAKMQAVSQYIGELRQKIGLYIGWTPNAYADQVAEDNAYNLLRKDWCIQTRLFHHGVKAAGEEFYIVHHDSQVVEILTGLLNKTYDFTHARYSLLTGGLLFGLSLQRKIYSTTEIEFLPGLEWKYIAELKEVDVRRLRIERDEENRNFLYWTIWSPLADAYVKILDRHEHPTVPDGNGIQDYVWYFHEREEINPYFRGIGEVLYPLAYIKKLCVQYWADLAESWAKPWMVLMLDMVKGAMSAMSGEEYKSAPEIISAWLEALENARSRHALVVDKSDKLDIIEKGTTGNNILRELVEYIDHAITQILIGSELITEAGSTGSYALGNIHEQQTETLTSYSRGRLQEIIAREILDDLVYQNRMNFFALGIKPPSIGEAKVKLFVRKEEQRDAIIATQIKRYKGDLEKKL